MTSLPTGGGALRAIGDTFQTDAHTGTGRYTVPLTLPPGRGGLTPSLALEYSTGNGTGPYGLGWQLALPAIRRRTDKRVPRYDGTDTYTLSGAEDLVPVPGATAPGVQRHRPRAESVFARIEHHTAGTDHWVVRDKSGTVSTYGTPRPPDAGPDWRDPATVAGPEGGQVAGWLLTATEDTFGNTIRYGYAPDPARPDDPQRYPDRIAYADFGDKAAPGHLVELRLVWEPRPDVHTDRRAGYPVTTGQRCRALETWVTAGDGQKVRTVALRYADPAASPAGNGVSLLAAVEVTGHDGESVQSLPPLTFGYSGWDPAARRFEEVGGAPPAVLDAPGTAMADVFGTGLPDLLTLDGLTARCRRNLGDASFGLPRSLGPAPAGAVLGQDGAYLDDADGDGRPDLCLAGRGIAGYVPLTPDGAFDPRGFVAAGPVPSLGPDDALTRSIDLDGDGVADLLRLGAAPQALINLRGEGWASVPVPAGAAPAGVSFADPRIRLADMTGDGLTDIVELADGHVRYWPNLGYGRFGPPVAMAGSPRFASSDAFGGAGPDPSRLLLGDVDGDGCADLVLVGADRLTVWNNRTGTGFADPVVVPGTPRADSLTSVRLADLRGTGTAGVLWGCRSAARGGRTYYLDLTGGVKPYLLTSVDDDCGGRTAITYRTSTRHALDDAARGTPWRTTLPVPVQVVDTVTVTEAFSGTTTASGWSYHHGHWDGADREFRGFGRVERTDTATVAASGADELVLPPVLTRTWYHLGPVGSRDAWRETDLSDEHWTGDPALLGAGDRSALPALPRRALREAVRALRGSVLREEVYALDGSAAADRPYTVTEHAYDLLPVTDAPEGTADPAWRDRPVVRAARSASRTTEWERGEDPRTTADFTLGFDAYGNPLRTLVAAVPRGRDPRGPAPAGDGAEPVLATVAETRYAVRDDDARYLADRVATATRYEVLADGGLPLTAFRAAVAGRTLPLRLRAHQVTRYDGPSFTGLAPGLLGDHGLPKASETLVLTAGMLAAALPDPDHAPYLRAAPATGEHGLLGDYFRDSTLTAPAFTRCDPGIDLRSAAAPDPVLDAAAWSARWSGALTARTAGPHTLRLTASGGRARLLLDGQPLLDASDGTAAADVVLDPARPRELGVEFRATGAVTGLTLAWTEPGGDGGPARPVPSTCLTPPQRLPDDWPQEYPPDFRTGLPPAAGYRYQRGDADHPAGFYAVTGAAHDVDTDPAGRGLTTAQRDALGHDTVIGYDAYGLLPVSVTDPAGLTVTARHDYRTFLPCEVTDANGNVRHAGYTPLGLPAWTASLGRPGREEGDTDEQPGALFSYGLEGAGSPLWVHTAARVAHRWDVVRQARQARAAAGLPPLTDAETAALFPPDERTAEPGRFVESRAYYDGLGRELQVRAAADPTVVADLGLPAEPDAPAGPLRLRGQDPAAPPVLVTGPTAYDNKGNPARAWEPYRDTGWAYRAPSGAERAALACTTTVRDALGRTVKVIHPDGSWDLAVYGVPLDPARPDDGTVPTPWERYAYDRNDNAGRSHPQTAAGWSAHWNTPVSTRSDPLGRPAATTDHLPDGPRTATRRYDVEGRLLALTDPLGRLAEQHTYDLLGRPLTSTLLDRGQVTTVRDAAGRVVEQRDAKGALSLTGYDALGRPVRGWAADREGAPVTLRTAAVYGDAPDSGLTPQQARDANLLGRSLRGYDGAGTVAVGGYDLSGRPLDVTPEVFAAATLLSAAPDPYTADWQPQTGQSLADRAAALLNPVAFTTSTAWDALGRRTAVTLPVDAEGRRRCVRYSYGREGHVTQVTVDGAAYLSRALYDARGRRVAAWLGNGTLTRSAYDPAAGTLTRLHSGPARADGGGTGGTGGTDAGEETWLPAGPAAQDQSHGYDLVGNLLALADRTPGSGLPGAAPDALDRSFRYDPLYRLTSATGREHTTPLPQVWSAAPRGTDPTATAGYTETYAYDAVGNLLALKHRTGSGGWTRTAEPAGGSDRLAVLTAGPDAYAYTYDPCGNVTGETDSRRFTWGAGNELTGFRVQAGADGPVSLSAQYHYAADGRRTLKLVRKQDGSLETTVYVGSFERLLTTAPGGTATAHDELHIGDGGERLAVVRVGPPLPDDRRPAVGYRLADLTGSCTAVLDAAGALVNREEYTPYGETSFGGYARKRYRFTGKERDEESGLAAHGARYYAPWLGRWFGCDPAGHVDAYSLYVYARANPLGLTDPSGLAARRPPKTGGGTRAPARGSAQAAPAPAADGALRSGRPDENFVTGAYEDVGGHHIAGGAAYDQPGAKDPYRDDAMCISQKEGDFTPARHGMVTKTQQAGHEALGGKFTGTRDVRDADGNVKLKVTVHEGASAQDRLRPAAEPFEGPSVKQSQPSVWAESEISYRGLLAADLSPEQSAGLVCRAVGEREGMGSLPARVPRTGTEPAYVGATPKGGEEEFGRVFQQLERSGPSVFSRISSVLSDLATGLTIATFVLDVSMSQRRGYQNIGGILLLNRPTNIALPNGTPVTVYFDDMLSPRTCRILDGAVDCGFGAWRPGLTPWL
jgi:RHS repeat-associated protein